MKAEVISISTIYNEDLSINCYQANIDFTEMPNLKLGKCEVKQ